MSSAQIAANKINRVQLAIRKSSLAAPIILLLVSVVLFIIYALPSGFDQLGAALGLTTSASEPLTLEKLAAALHDEKTRDKLWETFANYSFWEWLDNIVRPLVKIYLDQLAFDFLQISKSLFNTIWQLSLYSLLPGLAGLIYRRNFLVWFLISFSVLLAINASGVFGSLTTAQPMPGSGAIFFFLISQLVLLILAYRLRRHAQNSSRLLPPKIHNWGLTIMLVLVGIACWQGWGPGYRSASETPTPPTGVTSGTASEPQAPAPSADGNESTQPAAAPTEQPAATPTEPPAPESVAPSATSALAKADTGRQRSWIWSFLGHGFTGWIYKWEFILIGLPLIYTLLRNSATWPPRVRKNIVLCLDGTSNTPDQMEHGFAAHTNVYKLFKMLKSDKGGYVPESSFDASLCKKYKDKQIGFYYAGVGNKYDSDPILQTLGMATGMGASEIIERAYLDLIRVYQPDDRVFIVGFSRGAAIARLLARTIDARGAPRALWTLKLFGKHRTIWASPKKVPVRIDVLGCWDTVGSFGVAKTIAGFNFQQLNMFKDLTVPDNVAQAYHMLALDEQRDSFEPTLMDPDPIRPERIVEVWFAGDHANIGGGWATDKLSDVTLDFLLSRISSGYATDASKQPGDESWGVYLTGIRAKKADLAARAIADETGVMSVDPDPLGQVRHWFSNLYDYRPRKLPLHAVISETVFQRMTQSLPVYAPQALFDLNDALDAKRDLIDEKVAKLAETNSLGEEERTKVLEYKDKLRLTRWPKYWETLVTERHPTPPTATLSNAATDAAPAMA